MNHFQKCFIVSAATLITGVAGTHLHTGTYPLVSRATYERLMFTGFVTSAASAIGGFMASLAMPTTAETLRRLAEDRAAQLSLDQQATLYSVIALLQAGKVK